jgi:hypothetical protein
MRRKEPTPLNDRFNVMWKYRGFDPGIRKKGDRSEQHGACRVIFSTNAENIGTAFCPHCKGTIDAGRCTRCFRRLP